MLIMAFQTLVSIQELSLHSRHSEVNGCKKEQAHVFSCAHYFLAPATQATKNFT